MYSAEFKFKKKPPDSFDTQLKFPLENVYKMYYFSQCTPYFLAPAFRPLANGMTTLFGVDVSVGRMGGHRLLAACVGQISAPSVAWPEDVAISINMHDPRQLAKLLCACVRMKREESLPQKKKKIGKKKENKYLSN